MHKTFPPYLPIHYIIGNRGFPVQNVQARLGTASSWAIWRSPNLSAPNYRADLRQGVAMEYVSCKPAESAHELFDEEYEPVEEEQ